MSLGSSLPIENTNTSYNCYEPTYRMYNLKFIPFSMGEKGLQLSNISPMLLANNPFLQTTKGL